MYNWILLENPHKIADFRTELWDINNNDAMAFAISSSFLFLLKKEIKNIMIVFQTAFYLTYTHTHTQNQTNRNCIKYIIF